MEVSLPLIMLIMVQNKTKLTKMIQIWFKISPKIQPMDQMDQYLMMRIQKPNACLIFGYTIFTYLCGENWNQLLKFNRLSITKRWERRLSREWLIRLIWLATISSYLEAIAFKITNSLILISQSFHSWDAQITCCPKFAPWST